MNLTQEIDSRIQRFVAELNELVRKQALDAVSSALGSEAPVRRGPGRPPGSGAKQQAPSAGAAPKAAKGRSRRKGEKRTQSELAQLESSLESYVQNNPGQGIENIGKAIGFPTGELSRPMKKLVQRGAIRTEGAKRATKYYAGTGGGGGGTSAAATPKRRGPGRKAGAKKKSKKK